MRIAGLILIAALTAAVPAAAQTSLDELAVRAMTRDFPASPEAAPETLDIDAGLAAALRAQPVDGGREKTLYMALVDGRLEPRKSALGERYRATGRCFDCDFPQPIHAHTHPYDNGLSVIDLLLAAQRKQPMLMAAHEGLLWLAVPTAETLALNDHALDDWPPIRFGLFSNRLECPTRTPPDGWLGDSTMTRAVEAQARAAAAALRLALYVAEPGQPFRKLATPPADIPVLDPRRPLSAADLNAHERTLLSAMRAAGAGEVWPGPSTPDPVLEAALNLPAEEELNPAVSGGLRNIGNLTGRARAFWFSALPTTVYASSFSDPATPELAFVSVQNSPDCRETRVLEGVQTFAPDGVRYSRGWRRPRDLAGPAHAGWTPLAPADLPTDHLVPW